MLLEKMIQKERRPEAFCRSKIKVTPVKDGKELSLF
jgi:hypothetical protein